MTGRPPRFTKDKPRPAARRAAREPETELFQRTMAGVEPLKKKRALKAAAEREPLVATPPARSAAPRKRAAPAGASPPPAPAPPPLNADAFAGLDRRTAERLRRGKLPIDARLDLHGSYQDAAQAELNRFIAGCAATGCRTVLVITGKGRVGEGGGILRRRLPDWLNGPVCRPHVLAFTSARPEHGGGGAFYVLLRRRRDSRQ